MFTEISEKEFGIGGILTKSWAVYCQEFKAIAMVTLPIYIPINIILYILNEYIGLKEYISIVKIVEAFVGMISMMGVALIVENTIKNGNCEISWREALRKAFSRWGSSVGTSMLTVLIIVGFMLLLVIPGVIWSLYYIFVMQVVILRGIAGKAALNYSKSLVKGRWWNVFWKLLVLGLINIAIGVTIGFCSVLAPDVIGIIAETFFNIVTAFYIVGTTIIFLNLDYISQKK